jgi:hypothetical protein
MFLSEEDLRLVDISEAGLAGLKEELKGRVTSRGGNVRDITA